MRSPTAAARKPTSRTAALGRRLADDQAEQLVELYDHLQPFPDAVPALRALAGLGYELAVLSNGTPAIIGNCLDNSGLGEVFEQRPFNPGDRQAERLAHQRPGTPGYPGT